jgi:hypothetical protein
MAAAIIAHVLEVSHTAQMVHLHTGRERYFISEPPYIL